MTAITAREQWLEAQQQLIDLIGICGRLVVRDEGPGDFAAGRNLLATLLCRLEGAHPALAGAMWVMCVPEFAKRWQDDAPPNRARLKAWAIAAQKYARVAGRVAMYMAEFRRDRNADDIPRAMRRLKSDIDCIAMALLSEYPVYSKATWRQLQWDQHGDQQSPIPSHGQAVFGISGLSPAVYVNTWAGGEEGPVQVAVETSGDAPASGQASPIQPFCGIDLKPTLDS